jgi:BirA family transcriptional regulator, biotin operon repressor / biotin---[acetyl-CoA-carboxylase] ligase
MALDAYAGKEVVLQLAGAQGVHGVAAGVDETGAFLLRDPHDRMNAYSGGEISLRLGGRR